MKSLHGVGSSCCSKSDRSFKGRGEWAWCAALVVLASFVASAAAAPVTMRLGTGLPPSKTDGQLPQVWVAPVEKPPRLDGRLDDEAWSAARPMVLGKLQNDADVSPRTVARFVRCGDTLYLGCECTEPNIGQVRRAVNQPDGPAYQDDSIELFISPDPSSGYFQIVTGASGAIYDRKDRGAPTGWDSGAKSAVAVGQQGWTVELAIPMAALGIRGEPPRRWRANVYRNRQAGPEGQLQAWSPTLSNDYDVPERFGLLLLTPEPPAAEKASTTGPRGITVEDLGNRGAVLRFDLSALPKNAKVYRARLLCQRGVYDGRNDSANQDVEIYALAAPYQEGRAPAPAGRPLALVGPWFDSFDVTDLVRQWATGKGHPELYVKVFPGWQRPATYLDVMHEGQPQDAPPQVKGVRAFHRAGQTFITFREIEDVVGCDEIHWGDLKAILDNVDRVRQVRYCVYRSEKPITSATLAEADPIATVKPVSGWNLNGRNVEAGIDYTIRTRYALMHHQWNPWAPASMDGPWGRDCPMERLVITDGGKPLDRDTGLYVHTASGSAKAYYAVVTMIDGVQNTVDLSPANLVGPIDETKVDAQPVLQKEFPKQPYFNYPERRLHYVRWEAPPTVNVPSQYYNWSVAIPDEPPEPLRPYFKAGPKPLELSLHTDNRSYQRTQYRIEPDSIVVTPHDFPINTWWYGYHESLGTLKSFRQGIVQPYTERRIMWLLEWVCKKWPVDRNRILVTGRNRTAGGPGPGGWGGAPSGALHLAIRYPEIFNLCIPGGEARPDYAELVRNPGRNPQQPQSLEAIFGKLAWARKTDTGKTVWEELNLNRRLKELDPSTDVPPVTFTGRKLPPDVGEFMALMLEKGYLTMANFNTWTGPRLIPLSPRLTWLAVVIRVDVRKDLMMPTFSRGRAASLRGAEFTLINLAYRWRSDDIVDTPEKAAITLFRQGQGGQGDKTTDVTLRRCQKFKVVPGKTYHWTVEGLRDEEEAARTRPGTPLPTTEGDVTVGKYGLLTIPGVRITDKGVRLVVTAK